MSLLPVGEVAARLGVSASTVRMWGRRYGLTASARSPGGHRRFTAEDLQRLQQVHEAVVSGTSPAAAAALVNGVAPGPPGPPRRGGPGGAVLAVPGAGRAARGLARAAARLDEMAVEDTVLDLLGEQGTLTAWDLALRPVLVAAGEHWQRTGEGIEVEHMLTQALTTAFVRHVARLPEPARENPVLLAGGPHEEHVLALHAVRSALAEQGVPARLLGARTPMTSLASAARRTRAAGVLVWLSSPDGAAAPGLTAVARAHRRLMLLVGGPGWSGVDGGPATLCVSLADAVDRLALAWARRASATAVP